MNILRRPSSEAEEEDDAPRTASFICRSVLIIIVAGVLLRLIMDIFLTQAYDFYHWGVIVQNINSGNGLYELTGYFYTPPWGYVLGLTAFFQDVLGITAIGDHITGMFPAEGAAWSTTSTITTIAFNMSVKLVFLISDLVIGYLIFWLVRDVTKDHKKAILGFALWFLAPCVITVAAMGMFDTLCVLMTVLAVIMLRKDRYIESGVMLSMAALMKFFPGFLVFIFIAYIISKNREDGTHVKKTVMFLAAVAVTALVLFLPQLLDGTFMDSFLFITSRVDEGMGTGVIGVIAAYAALIVYAFVIVIVIILAMRMSKITDGEKLDSALFDTLLIAMAAIFIYPPTPQYILLLLPFVIIALIRDRRYLIPYCLLTVGAAVASVSGWPLGLASVAAHMDIINMGSLIDLIQSYTSPLIGISMMEIVSLVGLAVQYAGVLLVLWVRFGERIKTAIRRQTDAERTAE
ncbi:MAG: glycosyltransferase 87 family protein [Methanomassiliicoccaceae archaeon]|nr:glycosyltransferase 87 family protein [Methanomassiliicoccaceae archaeon]